MIRGIMVAALTLAFALAGRIALDGLPGSGAEEGAMALGLILTVGFVAGRFSRRAGMPGITGYLLTGLLLGPWAVSNLTSGNLLISPSAVKELGFIDSMALGLIAFTAGGEMKFSQFRDDIKPIAVTTAFQAFTAAAVFGLFLALGTTLGLTSLGGNAALCAAMILGVAAAATSPAITIAVINEFRAAGSLTRIVLGTVIFKDLFVIAAFAAAVAAARALLEPGAVFGAGFAALVATEVGGSVAVGAVLGALLALYISRVDRELPLIMLATAFAAVFLAGKLHLSGLLVCLVSGFVVENFSSHGEALVKAVEKYSLPVYVIFFAMAGASLDVGSASGMALAAGAFVAARLAVATASTWAALRVSRIAEPWARYAGLGFTGQAAVTLGFAAMAGGLPEIGGDIRTVLVAAVAVNQMIGPVLLKFVLARAGETGKAVEFEDGSRAGQAGVCEDL